MPRHQGFTNHLRLVIPSVGLALSTLGLLLVVTGMAAFVPPPGNRTHTVAEEGSQSSRITRLADSPVALSRRSAPNLKAGDRPLHEGLHIAPMAARDWLPVDRSRDRRADLMDMAISIRWHRGAGSDLPPGAN
jgi:hypothetical protein